MQCSICIHFLKLVNYVAQISIILIYFSIWFIGYWEMFLNLWICPFFHVSSVFLLTVKAILFILKRFKVLCLFYNLIILWPHHDFTYLLSLCRCSNTFQPPVTLTVWLWHSLPLKVHVCSLLNLGNLWLRRK